jgi:hypothetical protein
MLESSSRVSIPRQQCDDCNAHDSVIVVTLYHVCLRLASPCHPSEKVIVVMGLRSSNIMLLLRIRPSVS